MRHSTADSLVNRVIRGTFQSRAFLATGIALLKACFGLKMHGVHFVPPDRPLIFAGNHGSHYDGVFSMVAAYRVQRRVPIGVAWGGVRNFPISKQLIAARALELILTDDAPSPQSQALVLAQMIDQLEAGRSVVLHAEGHRHDALDEFQSGAAVAARAAGVPIVPLTLRGVHSLWKTLPWPDRWHGEVSVTFHPLIVPEDYSYLRPREAVAAITAELRRSVASAIDYPDALAGHRDSRSNST